MLVYDDVHNQMVNFTNSLLQFVSITESVTISEIFPKFLLREVKLLAGWLVLVGRAGHCPLICRQVPVRSVQQPDQPHPPPGSAHHRAEGSQKGVLTIKSGLLVLNCWCLMFVLVCSCSCSSPCPAGCKTCWLNRQESRQAVGAGRQVSPGWRRRGGRCTDSFLLNRLHCCSQPLHTQ